MVPSLSILALGNFAVGTSALVASGVLNLIAADLHIGLGAAGTVITSYAISFALCAVLMGNFTAHVPRKTLLLVALSLFTVGNLGSALAPNLWVLVLARVLAALGASIFAPVASGVAAALVPLELRGRAMALVLVGVPIATVLGVPLGTWIGGTFGWRSTFWMVSLLSGVALLGLAVLVRPITVVRPTANGQDLLKQPALIRTFLVMLLLSAGQFVVFPYLTAALRNITGLDTTGITLMLLVFGAAGLLGNALGGRLTDLWSGPRTLVIGLFLTAAPLLLLPILLPHAWSVFLGMLVWGVGGLLVFPPQQARVVELAPEAPSMALSLNASARAVGIALGSVLGGVFANQHLVWLGILGGGVVLLAALVAPRGEELRVGLEGKRVRG
jgi:predicted MFS family arabinose efflux permease